MHDDIKKLIDDLCLMDDDFSELVFQSDKRLIEHVLRIILRNDELEVLESRTQFSINSPTGRHVRFDVRAKLGNGELCDIEFQNADDGFLPYRAEFNLGLLNSSALKRGEGFDKLPQTYVIFITRKDTQKDGMPYHEFMMQDVNTKQSLGGFSHIIFVNGEYSDVSNPFGKLIHDLQCTKSKEMYSTILAEKVESFKDPTTKEGKNMCQKVEKYADELSIIRVVQAMLDLQSSEDIILDYVMKKFNVSLEDSQKYFEKACEKTSA